MFTQNCGGTSSGGSTPDTFAQSVAGQSADPAATDASKTVALTGTALPDTLVNMVLAPFVNIGVIIEGDAFTVNLDGSITCNYDMGLIEVSCMVKARYSSSDTANLGVGIGDPLNLPTVTGVTNASGTYVSRFVDSKRGEGTTRNQTMALNYFAVGKSQTIAAFAGDKIFPVLWTEGSGAVSIICKDFIFAIKAVRYIL